MDIKTKFLLAPQLLLAVLFFSMSGAHGEEKTMSPNETKTWIKKVFTAVLEDMNANEATYRNYFAENYIQYVDGKTLTLSDFIEHMKKQKAVMSQLTVRFKHVVVEGDNVATVHVVEGTKKNGSAIKVQVNAFFRLQGQKIAVCDELTHLLDGTKEDADLGSRR